MAGPFLFLSTTHRRTHLSRTGTMGDHDLISFF